MKKVVLLIGGGQYNRGSEAMVRGCIKTLREKNHDIYLIVSSRDDNTGNSLSINGVDKYVKRFTYNRNNKLIRYTIAVLRYILHLKRFTNWLNHFPLLNECRDADLVIVVGGDNYDNAYGAFQDMHSFNKTLRKITTGKMVLLNCSINPDEINEKIICDLNLFDKVTIREKVTFSALKQYVSKDLIEYYPDIAFNMKSKKVSLPECFQYGDVVGVNLSPLILRKHYTAHAKTVFQECCNIITYIINNEKKQVLLIPHVMKHNDLSILEKLYEPFKSNPHVFLLNDESLTSPELKYIISQCYAYFGARTHSTIAAYSSYIPTFVLGYSVKSIGIAKDLFDTTKGYVMSVQNINKTGDLSREFEEFMKKRNKTAAKLRMVMPDYLNKANLYSEFFYKILGNEDDKSK